MPFQTSVLDEIRSGLVGEIAFDGPTRAIAAVIDSGAGAENNVIGRVFTYADESVESVQAGGEGEFAGIFVMPKTHVLRGTAAGGTLAESLLVPDGTPGEFLQMGEVYVSVATDGATIGSVLKYNTTTGVIDHGAPGAGEAAIPNAVVSRHNASPTAAGAYLVVARLTN